MDHSLLFWNTRDYLQLETIINEVRPSIIINCIALADVDLSESLPERSYLLNSFLPYHLGKICDLKKIKLIHLSTDHFENEKKFKLTESEIPNCVNRYAHSKLLGETWLLAEHSNCIVVRTNFFHFDHRFDNKFVNKALINITQNKNIKGLVDTHFTPISTAILIENIFRLIKVDFAGLINIASNLTVTKYDFLVKLYTAMGKSTQSLTPCLLSDLELVAPRPKNMSLDNSLFLSLIPVNLIDIDQMIENELDLLN